MQEAGRSSRSNDFNDARDTGEAKSYHWKAWDALPIVKNRRVTSTYRQKFQRCFVSSSSSFASL